MRLSLKTRDLQRAARRLTEMGDRISGKTRKTITDEAVRFSRSAPGEWSGNQTKVQTDPRIPGRYVQCWCLIQYVDQVDVEAMDRYALLRGKESWGWVKEIEVLVQFFEFSRDREWTLKNPARSLKRPRMIEAIDVVPYTRQQIVAIIAACDKFGKTSYERRRARAMVLLMRYAGLRISDVVTLSRDHIRGNRLEKRAVKNNRWIRVEVPSSVPQAL